MINIGVISATLLSKISALAVKKNYFGWPLKKTIGDATKLQNWNSKGKANVLLFSKISVISIVIHTIGSFTKK